MSSIATQHAAALEPPAYRLRHALAHLPDTFRSLAWSPDGKSLASGSGDNTVRVWDAETGRCTTSNHSPYPSHHLVALEFGPAPATAVIFGETILGDPDIIAGQLAPAHGDSERADETVGIVTAKIVLAGESGVGKSALALRLAEDRFEEQFSTHGMRLWSLPPERLSSTMAGPPGERREVTIWDLGG